MLLLVAYTFHAIVGLLSLSYCSAIVAFYCHLTPKVQVTTINALVLF